MTSKNRYAHLPSLASASASEASVASKSFADSATNFDDTVNFESAGEVSSFASSTYPHRSTSSLPLQDYTCGEGDIVEKRDSFEGLAVESLKAVSLSAALVKDVLNSFAGACITDPCKGCVDTTTMVEVSPKDSTSHAGYSCERNLSMASGGTTDASSASGSSVGASAGGQGDSKDAAASSSPWRYFRSPSSFTTPKDSTKESQKGESSDKPKRFGFLRRSNRNNKDNRKIAIKKKPSSNPLRKPSLLASNSESSLRKQTQKEAPHSILRKPGMMSKRWGKNHNLMSPSWGHGTYKPLGAVLPSAKIKSIVTVTRVDPTQVAAEEHHLYTRKREVNHQSSSENLHTIHVGAASQPY